MPIELSGEMANEIHINGGDTTHAKQLENGTFQILTHHPYKTLSYHTHTIHPFIHSSTIHSINNMPSRSTGVITQDWEPVVLHKSKPKAQDLRDPKAVNRALRSGAEVLTVKKHDAGSNKKTGSGPVLNARKLEEGTEPAALERVAGEVRHAIQKARVEKKMSQAELAKQINERTQVVQEYENGQAVPNQAVLAKIERVLGVKLRGKIGK